MTDTVTRLIVHAMSPQEMVRVHNTIPGVRSVTRLGDHGTARRRVELALERAGLRMIRGRADPVPVTHRVGNDRLIRILVDENPRNPNSASWHRFEILRQCETVGDYFDRAPEMGITRRKAGIDLRVDVIHGNIRLASS